MASEQQWTPGFGRPYFVEPKYYKSPKLKDVNIPDDATNIPNSAHLKYNKYYSNEEVLDIWAKPLDSKDYVATPEEISRLQANPTNSAFRALLIGSTNAPCVAHLQNMFLDKCNDPAIGTKNTSMLQFSQCNRHFYNFNVCLNKHRKWYDARFKSLAEAVPEAAPRFVQDIQYDQDPSIYDEFKPVQASALGEEDDE